MKKLIIFYSFIAVNIMALMGFIGAETPAQLISAVLFFPLAFYFWLLVLPKRKKALVIPAVSQDTTKPPAAIKLTRPEGKVTKLKKETSPEEGMVEEKFDEKGFSIDRRQFIKLIGSAGITVFLFSIFTKKAQAAFFGSVPGPGTVALKDKAGTKIDPAEKQPTDGYKVSEVDDASTPAYYGFVDKGGAWFIMREESSGTYKYVQGSSDFSGNWLVRTTDLNFKYFDEVF